MKRNGGGFEPSYNVQISTDAAAGIIIGLDVTQSGADAPHLQAAVERVRKRSERRPINYWPMPATSAVKTSSP